MVTWFAAAWSSGKKWGTIPWCVIRLCYSVSFFEFWTIQTANKNDFNLGISQARTEHNIFFPQLLSFFFRWTNVMLICSLVSTDKFYWMCVLTLHFNWIRWKYEWTAVWFECNLKYCWKYAGTSIISIWNAVQSNNKNLLLQFDDGQILN